MAKLKMKKIALFASLVLVPLLAAGCGNNDEKSSGDGEKGDKTEIKITRRNTLTNISKKIWLYRI